jgi:hypothetical protein
LDLPHGSRVVDHLPLNPWGDLEQFRKAVFVPLFDEGPGLSAVPGTTELIIAPTDVAYIRDVVGRLDDSITGGVPWGALSAIEREAVARVLVDLG